MVYLLPFLSYLAGSESVSARPPARPSDPDTMTITTLEAVALTRGNDGRDERRHLGNESRDLSLPCDNEMFKGPPLFTMQFLY